MIAHPTSHARCTRAQPATSLPPCHLQLPEFLAEWPPNLLPAHFTRHRCRRPCRRALPLPAGSPGPGLPPPLPRHAEGARREGNSTPPWPWSFFFPRSWASKFNIEGKRYAFRTRPLNAARHRRRRRRCCCCPAADRVARVLRVRCPCRRCHQTRVPDVSRPASPRR